MKAIIAGTRNLPEFHTWRALVECPWTEQITEVVSGGARGPDTFGAMWATEQGFPVKFFYSDWNLHGKAAGPIRNEEMAKYADALLAVWDGKSKGTKDMIARAERYELAVFVYRMTPQQAQAAQGE